VLDQAGQRLADVVPGGDADVWACALGGSIKPGAGGDVRVPVARSRTATGAIQTDCRLPSWLTPLLNALVLARSVPDAAVPEKAVCG
jgi:hypothetical protein